MLRILIPYEHNVISFLILLLSQYQKEFNLINEMTRENSGFVYKELYDIYETLETTYLI